MKKHDTEDGSINSFFGVTRYGQTWLYEECDKDLLHNGSVVCYCDLVKNPANELVIWISEKLGFKVDWFYREFKIHLVTAKGNRDNLVKFLNSVLDNSYAGTVTDEYYMNRIRTCKIVMLPAVEEVKESSSEVM